MAHPARRSREIDATIRGSPSPPFAIDRCRCPRLTQARRSREIAATVLRDIDAAYRGSL